MRHLKSLQALRGIAALMVVAFHAQSIEQKYFAGLHLLPASFHFGQTGVDLFFVISGFVMVLTTRRQQGQVSQFLWKRFMRIYPVYWVYFAILAIVFLLAPQLINSSQGGRVDLLSSMFLLPSAYLPLLPVAWSLTLELWFYVVFAFMLALPRTFILPGLLLWLGLVAAANLSGHIPSNPALRVAMHCFAVEFILGALACITLPFVSKSLAVSALIAGCVTLTIAFTNGYVTNADVIAGGLLPRAVVVGGGYAMFLLGATSLERLFGRPKLAGLAQAGDWSYSIYLSHVLVLSVMGRLWTSLPLQGTAIAVAWWLLTTAAVLICGFLSYRLIEVPVMRLSRQRLSNGTQISTT